MGMNQTPSGNRIHIGFFGKRNAGKSSLVNAVIGQELAVVSAIKGTTTDPVYKTMELLPLGPVMVIDTPGIDDEGNLGELRINKTRQVLNKTDIAVLVVDSTEGITEAEEEMVLLFREKEVPYLIVYNKADLIARKTDKGKGRIKVSGDEDRFIVSARTGEGVHKLKERLAHIIKTDDSRFRLISDLLHSMDLVVLVVPIDSSAPKGRLILPQQQVIRDVLEVGAVGVVVRDTELKQFLHRFSEMPRMVITDSQVFKQVAEDVPQNVELTSFSILMARQKGFLKTAVQGVLALDTMQNGDKILIAEGCTHHRQCEDIGTVKLPGWIKEYTGKEIEFVFCSGTEFPEDLSPYRLVIHCGGCMLNEREMHHRMRCAAEQKIPFTNYGTAIAYINGILKRSVEMLPEIKGLI